MSAKLDEPSYMNAENDTINDWIRFGARICVTTAFHPIEQAKVLIQLGFEPIAPRLGHTFLGRPAMKLPNIFQYIKHIRRTDGFIGCYRGLSPKLVGIMFSAVGSEKIATKLGLEALPEPDEMELSDEESLKLFARQLKRDVVLSSSCIVISQPFMVISYRMMAQFIGRETMYSSMSASIKEIWREEGIFGFFSGLTPRLLFDVSCVVLASSTTYYFARYIGDKQNRSYFAGFIHFVYSSMLYPLLVVSTCMAVTGSRLRAGMPIYNDWLHCYRALNEAGQLKRGSSLFWRYERSIRMNNTNANVPLPPITKSAY